MDHPIRFGIMGCGLAAGFHAAAIGCVEDAVLTGVFDVSAERAQTFAHTFGCTAYLDLAAFAQSPEIDAVCVCTPSGYHADNAVILLNSGKNLLIEKPLAVDPAQGRSILRAATENGRTVGVVSQLRCCPDVKRLKEIIASGTLGRLISVQLSMLYHRSEAYYRDSVWHGTLAVDGGGALINQGIHGVDLLLYLIGPVKRVSAVSATLRHSIEAEDTLAALLEFENGCLGTLNAATSVSPGHPRTFTVCGTKGSAVLTEDRLTSLVTEKNGVLIGGEENTAYLSHSDPGAIPPEAHENVVRDFCEALRTGRAPASDGTDGYNALALIDAAYKAAKHGPQTPEFIQKNRV